MTLPVEPPNRPATAPAAPRYTPAEGFWEHFLKEHWGQKPGVFRDVLPGLIATPDEVFEGIRASWARRETDVRSVYVNGRRCTPAESFTFAPKPEETFEPYLSRITAEQEVTFVIYGMQVHAPELWVRTREFISGFIARLGVPIDVELELFSGKYRATPRGPHRDDASNLSWILHGEKTMLVWPPDFFEKRGVPTATQRGQTWGRDLCDPEVYKQYQDEAVVLHAKEGELLYWPYTWWHMAVADKHDAPMMLNTCVYNRPKADALGVMLMGLMRQMELGRIDNFGRFDPAVGGDSPAPADIVATLAHLGGLCASEQMRGVLAERFVKHASSSGFTDVPARAPKALPADVGTVHIDARFPIAFRQDGEALRVWSNGHAITLPATPQQVELLTRLNAGTPVPVDLGRDAALRPLLEELQSTRVLSWGAPA
ncbi:cupin-like domain-containing protein [Corallococcus sp. BB11-1]|uniref:cupin-like domain-containing protein n=1 Tax=Corallococcus sp. BB11-1 TaxID=2996783 RepID=UPI002270A4E7|nr:cupin-like domain-containing protein [Corallococcus sp. BB11-1]MCY1035340.1 cupin-like domain-containing protein [Corallococcus sp. BB11-1]